VTLRNGKVKTRATIKTPGGVPTPLPAWEIPDAIHNPFVQFAAARGYDGWLREHPFFGRLSDDAFPNQLFLWAQQAVQMGAVHTYAAGRVRDAGAFVKEAQASVGRELQNHRGEMIGNLIPSTNTAGFRLHGFPFVEPGLQPAKDLGRDYAFFGMFPAARFTNAFPDELRRELQRTNLLYYGWEITAESFGHWNLIAEIWEMSRLRAPLTGPAQKWASATTRTLGNSITEVLRVGDHELLATREGPGPMTAAETAFLVHWLDWERLHVRKNPLPGGTESQAAPGLSPPKGR
jgi:hypothetical protein